MQPLKILMLSSIFLFANCSLINDKYFSKSDKTLDEKSEEQEIVMERVYIEDEKEEKKIVKKQEGLQGDTDFQNNIEYPNLADVPTRPDPSISLEEQDSIIKNLENDNFQLEPTPSKPVIEDKVSNLETAFNNTGINKNKKKYKNVKSYKDTNNSIRNIQSSKLDEIKNFRPDPSYSKNQTIIDDDEKELHSLARELKNIKTSEQINKIEERIKKNDLYYGPKDIEKILGLKGLDSEKEKNKATVKKTNISKKQNIAETKIIEKKIEEREVPVARVTFNHGSSQLSDEDLLKIKKVANLFYENKGKKIVIVGHSSSRTNYDMDLTKHALVNFNISLERATKVMSEFSTIGLNSQKIELVAMSDAKPLYAEIMPSLEAANRRAEIFIQY